MAAKLKTELQRPEGMMDNKFVNPDAQCPKKPRGRKKKNHTPADTDHTANDSKNTQAAESTAARSRPSAAACGFSTTHMTDAEVHERLDAMKKGQVSAAKASSKRSRKHKAHDQVEDSKPSKMADPPHAEATEPEQSTSKPTNRRKTKVSEAEVTSKKRRGKANVENAAAPEPEQPTSKPTKRRKTKVSEAEVTSKKRRGKANVENAAAPEPEQPTNKPTKRRNTRSKVAKTGTNGNASASGSSAPAETDANSTTAEAGSDVEASVSMAAAKAKASRKSSAYHKARYDAKKRGLSDEEQKEAGKAVSWYTI